MPLRKADRSHTRRFEDGDAWLVLRTELTHGERQRMADLATSSRWVTQNGTPIAQASADDMNMVVDSQIAELRPFQFEILCKEWSLGGVSAEAYRGLDDDSGIWVDECMDEVLRIQRERAEKNGSSPEKPESSESSSAEAEAQTLTPST